MDRDLKEAIIREVGREPFARLLGMKLIDLDLGYALVETTYDPSSKNNIYRRAHGGAIFSLIDEAFQVAGQTYGSVAVALNVNVTYVASPEPGAVLRAEAREISLTKRTGTFDIRVTDDQGRLIAACQAVGFRTGKPIPFLNEQEKDKAPS